MILDYIVSLVVVSAVKYVFTDLFPGLQNNINQGIKKLEKNEF